MIQGGLRASFFFCTKMERTLDITGRLWYDEVTERKLSIKAAERGQSMKNRLEELRKARGIKQEELASALAIEDIFIYEEEGDT